MAPSYVFAGVGGYYGYCEVFGTHDGGESWLKMPLPHGVQHIYALACG